MPTTDCPVSVRLSLRCGSWPHCVSHCVANWANRVSKSSAQISLSYRRPHSGLEIANRARRIDARSAERRCAAEQLQHPTGDREAHVNDSSLQYAVGYRYPAIPSACRWLKGEAFARYTIRLLGPAGEVYLAPKATSPGLQFGCCGCRIGRVADRLPYRSDPQTTSTRRRKVRDAGL